MDNSIIKKLKIVRIIEETPEAKSFLLEPLDGWSPSYKPGQFITLVFYTKHGEKRRSYSLVSIPGEGQHLTITVKKIENGEFSRALVYYSKEGDTLFSSGIGGFFTVDENKTTGHFCFIVAGSGITPCFALIKTLLSKPGNTIVLIYSNSNKTSTIFYDALLQLKTQHEDRFTIHFLFSDHQDLYYKRLSKWLLDQLLDRYIDKKTNSTFFYLCGPFSFMQMAEITLLNRSTRDRIIKENFSSLPRLILPEPPDTKEHAATVHINGNTYTFKVKYPLSILKSAKRHQIELPYSCEAGRCGSCIASCTTGKVWMAYNEVLTDKEVRQGRILVCQAFPINGDVEITFDR